MEEDKILYKSFLEGNQKDFEKLVEKYKNNIIYFISRYVKNIDISEDIFQDTILFLLENKNYYDFNYSFKTYLYMIAKSKAINYINREKNIENIDDVAEEIKEEALLEEIILAKERQKKINYIINLMPQEYQIVLYLTKIEGLSYKETALIMEKKVTQIKRLSFSARKKLRKLCVDEKVVEIKNKKIVKLLIIFLCIGVISSSFVFAESIFEFINNIFFGGSKSIETAVNNGYISTSNSDFVVSNDIGIKINNLIMDDTYLGIHFKSSLNNFQKITFEKIIIFDENKNILYCNNEEQFSEYCKNNNLNYIWGECNDNYINSGVNINDLESGECVYNLYSDNFPKSKTIFVNIKNVLINSEKEKLILRRLENFYKYN